MKTKHLLFTLLLSFIGASLFAQYPSRDDHGHKYPDQNQRSPRGHSHHDDDEPYGTNEVNIQLALLLDASGSMDGLLDQAKSQLWTIVNEINYTYEGYGYPQIEIAVYEYGNNRLGSRSGYMRQVVPFTTDLDWVADGLYGIRADGNQEYCGQVIERASQELRWSYRHDAVKMIYIAGNETFTQGRVDYRRAIRSARQKGITVHSIFCGPYRDGIYKHWQDAAELGGGIYTTIDQNSGRNGRRHHKDNYLSSLNNQLNDTYIPYGVNGQRNFNRMQQQDRNANQYGQQNLAQRTITKASPNYQTDKWDLVTAVSHGKVRLADIPNNQLPPQMRNMSLSQKQAYLNKKKQEKDRVSQEVLKIGKERHASVERQTQATTSAPGKASMTLDQAIIRSSKQQIKQGNVKPRVTTKPQKMGTPSTKPQKMGVPSSKPAPLPTTRMKYPPVNKQPTTKKAPPTGTAYKKKQSVVRYGGNR